MHPASQRTLDVIYGRSGPPPMRGVLTYSFSRTQKVYREEFEQIVAGCITHPFLSVTRRQLQSAPHDLIVASAYSESPAMTSESKRQFGPKDLDEAYNAKGVGIRSEQMCFIG
jgi:hypothetical protein